MTNLFGRFLKPAIYAITVSLWLGYLPKPALAQYNESIPCALAKTVAALAYDRTIASKKAKNDAMAFAHKEAFWDIHQYSQGCDALKSMADQLKKIGLAQEDKAPALTTAAAGYNVGAGGAGVGAGVYGAQVNPQIAANPLPKPTTGGSLSGKTTQYSIKPAVVPNIKPTNSSAPLGLNSGPSK